MKIVAIALAGVLSLSSASMFAASGREDSIERLQAAAEVMHDIFSAPDRGIPGNVMDSAKCVIVVPHLVKGGFVFGGKHGRGVATCRTADGWSAPAFISIGGGSWGLQIGVQEVDLVMLIMNDRGTQHLLASKFELSGEGCGCSWSGGPPGSRWYRLEDEHGSVELFADQRHLWRVDARGRRRGAGQRLHLCDL